MRLLVLALICVAGALAATAAPAHAAPCRAVAEDGGREIARAANGTWFECRSGRTFRMRGKLKGFAGSRTAALAVLGATKGRTRVVMLDLHGRRQGRRVVTFRRGERVHRPKLHGSVAFFGLGGRQPWILSLTVGEGQRDFHGDPGVEPATLRLTGDILSWRESGATRRFDLARGEHVPPPTCAAPPYAKAVATMGAVTAFELLLQSGEEAVGELFACVPGSAPTAIGDISEDLGGVSKRLVAVDGDHAAFLSVASWKETSYSIASFDLRRRARIVGWAGVGSSGCVTICMSNKLGAVVLSPSGRIAVGRSQQWTDSDESGTPQNSVLVVDGEEVVTIDEDPAVDINSLRVEGATLSWLHGSERRSMPFE